MALKRKSRIITKASEIIKNIRDKREEKNSTNVGIGEYTSKDTNVTIGGTTSSTSTSSGIGSYTSSDKDVTIKSSRKSSGKSTLLTPTTGATANQTSTRPSTPTGREALISGKSGRPSRNQPQVYLPGTVYRYTAVGKTGTPVSTYYEVQNVGESRVLSQEEIRQYEPPTVVSGEDKTRLQIEIGETTGKIKKKLQEEYEPRQYFVGEVQDWAEKGGKGRKIVSEVVTGFIPKTTGEVLFTGALFGAGTVLGAATKTGSSLIRTVPKAGKYLGTTYDVGVGTFGIYETGRYTSDIYSQIKATGSYEPLGKGIREFGALGLGFSKGTKIGESWTAEYEKGITIPMKEPEIAFERIKVLETPEGGTKKVSEFIQIKEVEPAEITITSTKLRDTLNLKPKIESKPADIRYFVSEQTELGSKKPFVVSEVKEGRTFFNVYGIKTNSKYLGKINDVRFDLALVESTKAGRVSKRGNIINVKTPLLSGFEGFRRNLAFDMPLTKSKLVLERPEFKIRRSYQLTADSRKPIKTTSFEFADYNYETFFHGTTKSKLKSIKKEGLLPSSETGLSQGLSDKNLVSLGLTKESVEGFANRAVLKSRLKGIDDKPIILKVRVKKGEYESGIGKSGIGEVRVKKVESKDIQLLVLKEEEVVLPKLSIKIPKKQIKLKETKKDNLPLMVGGTGATTSLFTGQGLYERTESTSVMKLPSLNEIKIENIKVVQDIKPIETEIIKGKSKSKSRQLEITKPIELTKLDEGLKPIFKEKQLSIQKEKFGQLQVQRLAQALKQVQQSKNVLFTPKISINLPKTKTKLKLSKKMKSGNSDFEAVGFRFGKPVSLGKFEEKRIASKELKEFLSSTLGASGYLKFGEKKLKAEETGLLEEFGFRKSKTGNKFLVVEEKPLRLRRGTTGKDIQFFR